MIIRFYLFFRDQVLQPNSIVTPPLPDFLHVDVPVSLSVRGEAITAPLVPPAASAMPTAAVTTTSAPPANPESSAVPSTSSEATPSSSTGPASSTGEGKNFLLCYLMYITSESETPDLCLKSYQHLCPSFSSVVFTCICFIYC